MLINLSNHFIVGMSLFGTAPSDFPSHPVLGRVFSGGTKTPENSPPVGMMARGSAFHFGNANTGTPF